MISTLFQAPGFHAVIISLMCIILLGIVLLSIIRVKLAEKDDDYAKDELDTIREAARDEIYRVICCAIGVVPSLIVAAMEICE